ncbi:uncharacterized protein LOC108845215 [Raphanus sativus]|uniref:Uncharacterized protein LOC108845215 n=1 Tax=Raphanus sativus TaxID=3726 RepID=A0A6J0MN98_RAPSA|nr:uncharacterized protein LOC108845215 [Raphanus sativus]
MGKLIDIAGDSSTMLLGINRYATVADVASSGQWNIRRCRSCHLWAMIAAINSVPPPVEDAGSDRVLWKHRDDNYRPWFSSSRTWDQLREHSPIVEWSDRTSAWGEVQGCRLCGEPDETRDYLFFACPYSFTVWTDLTVCLLPRPSPDWNITMTTLLSPRRNKVDSCLLRLAFQGSIYLLWREHNGRKHNNSWNSPAKLVKSLDRTIRNRISSI